MLGKSHSRKVHRPTKIQMQDSPKKGAAEDMTKLMSETCSMSRRGSRDEKDPQKRKENIQEDLNKMQPPRVPQVSWGLEGRCVSDVVSDIVSSADYIQDQDQQESIEKFHQQGTGGNKAAGGLNQYGSNAVNTLIKEPTLSDVFIISNKSNAGFKKGYHGYKTGKSKNL